MSMGVEENGGRGVSEKIYGLVEQFGGGGGGGVE